ncbi:MAG: phosphatase PAP2 family protein [Bacteroidetes bacterium]|nr:phosphatase PAP2 family protein [Bacteroidota bacterium]
MKKIFIFNLTIAIFLLVLTQISCNKSISGITANVVALNPTNQDLNAGTWKTVLLSSPDTFAVAAPAATNAASYLADLNEIKGYQQNLSADDQQNIKYWSAGGVLRWNEIMRELVAKYNLAPYQNSEGIYPIPSSVNPFAYPLFPFANPPYAARAYAYISAAQYDALVACWHYKKLYNRPAPYAVDSNVHALVPKTSLSSYPSEAAVLAGVTAEMMKLLFPAENANIQQKLQQQELAAIQSGAATRSDVMAGEALGRQVANLFTARAKTDHASNAVGTPTEWASLATQTQANGQTPWISLESPARPPMLPLFGNVTPFLFNSATVASLRPGPPPSANSDTMALQTQMTYNQIKSPTREQMAIVQIWADGIGTYTPPGHWNYIAALDFINQNYSEVRWARNMALLNMALMDAGIVCWNTKYYYFNPRPTQLNPLIKTLTGIPNFPSYISGHATFSEAASTILGHIIPANAARYEAMSQQASNSRYIAGIHTQNDCTTALKVGRNVGNFAILRAEGDGAE